MKDWLTDRPLVSWLPVFPSTCCATCWLFGPKTLSSITPCGKAPAVSVMVVEIVTFSPGGGVAWERCVDSLKAGGVAMAVGAATDG